MADLCRFALGPLCTFINFITDKMCVGKIKTIDDKYSYAQKYVGKMKRNQYYRKVIFK